MAKRSNNSRSKKLQASKPYDISNSFVKKVASRVTELIPQSIWPTNWFSSTNNEACSRSDGREFLNSPHLLEDVTEQNALPKRGRIPLDSSLSEPIFGTSISTSDFKGRRLNSIITSSVDVEDGEAVAGPSGIHKKISAGKILRAKQKSRDGFCYNTRPLEVNGEDHSDSSESTSGCSSLPQTDNNADAHNSNQAMAVQRQGSSPETVTRAGAKRRRKEETNYSSLAVSNSPLLPSLEGFSSPGRAVPVGRRRNPSFNPDVFGHQNWSGERNNIKDRIVNSPFYSGRTTYGGVSAYQNHLNRSDNQHTSGLRSIRVHPVKTSEARGDGSVGMSNTARRILEALEMFSSPIQDAKKIPLSGSLNVKRRKILSNLDASQSSLNSPSSSVLTQDTNAYNRLGGFTPPVKELIVPTVPDILALRRRQRLQGSTVAAREVANETNIHPFSEQNVSKNDGYWAGDRGGGGKIRAKIEIDEETVEEPDLPNVSLPITSLPKFDFLLSSDPPSYSQTKTDSSKFKFSFPITVTSASESLVTSNTFTFSSPLKASNKDASRNNGSNSDLVCTTESVQMSLENTGSDLAAANVVEENTEIKNLERSLESSTDKNLSGKDILLQTKTQGSYNNLKFSLGGNNFSENGTVMENFKPITSAKKGKMYSIQNNTKPLVSPPSRSCSENKSPEVPKVYAENKFDFGDRFKPPSGSWTCEVCMISNPSDKNKCLACETPRTSKETAVSPVSEETKSTPGDFGDKFKKPDGDWDCTICLVRNKAGGPPKCVACETPKPGSESPAVASDSSTSSKFSLGSAVDSGFQFGIDKAGNLPKKESSVEAQPSFTFGSSAPATGFTFGIKPEGDTKASGFTFGIPSSTESSEVDAPKNSIVSKNTSIFGSVEIHATKLSPELAKIPFEKEKKVDDAKDIETKTLNDADLKSGVISNIPALTGVNLPVPTGSELKPVFSFTSSEEKLGNSCIANDSSVTNGKWKLDGKPSNNNLTSSNTPIFNATTTVASWNSKPPFKLDSSPKSTFFPQTSTSAVSAIKNSDKQEESTKTIPPTFRFGDVSKFDSTNSKQLEVPKTSSSSSFKFQELPKSSSVFSLEEKVKSTSSVAPSITSNPISSDTFSGTASVNLNVEKTLASSEKPNSVTAPLLSDSTNAGKTSNSGPVFMFGSESGGTETAFNLGGQKPFGQSATSAKEEPLKLYSNIGTTPGLFNVGSGKPTIFGSVTSSPSPATAASLPAPATKARTGSLFASTTLNPSFGSSVTSSVTTTSTSTTTAVSTASNAFGSSIFGSPNQIFGSSNVPFGSASAGSSGFGVRPSSPVFGVNSTPSSTPFSFSGSAKPTSEEQTSQPVNAFVFGSGSTPSVQPFSFSAPANKPAFSFGSSTQPVAGTSAQAPALPSAPALGFSFGDASKGSTPFGSVQPATSIAGGTTNPFGAASSIAPAPASFGTSLGETNPAVTAAFGAPTFNFGSSQSNPTFSFSNNQSASLPTNIAQPSGFNFGQVSQPNAAPQPVTFNPNVPPSFNFTGGTPAQFTATPGNLNVPPSANTMQRRFKKAVRRTQQTR